jgi:hypothetical protein
MENCPMVTEKEQALKERIDELSRWIQGLMPDSRELEMALTKLEECELWANKGLPKGDLQS